MSWGKKSHCFPLALRFGYQVGKNGLCPSANITEGWSERRRMRCYHLWNQLLFLFYNICFVGLYMK